MTTDVRYVCSTRAYRQLSWWGRLLHRLGVACPDHIPRYVLVRHAVYQPDVSALMGEVWTLCPVCGRVRGTRRELPVDASRFGLSEVRDAHEST